MNGIFDTPTTETPKDKQTKGKIRVDLLPVRAIEEVAKAFQWGVDGEKYPPWGWLTVEDWQDKYYGATVRHLFAYRKGETVDPKSGLHPLAHAVASGLILLARHIGIGGELGNRRPGRNSNSSIRRGESLSGGDALESGHSTDNGPGKNRSTRASTRHHRKGKSVSR
jgi:hypothetical protein